MFYQYISSANNLLINLSRIALLLSLIAFSFAELLDVQHITVRVDPLDQPRGTCYPFAYSELRGEIRRVELAVAH